jgi:DNA processing protein
MPNPAITPHDERYPAVLGEIAHPPKQLYINGELETSRPLVAVVGSRKATSYGQEAATRIAGELARSGVGVVSGLAFGIDAAAHRAAVDAGGYTVAVMASGLDIIHPVRNRQLARDIIASGGALVTEYRNGTPPTRQRFPARNRIIAGLCAGTIIVEAGVRSGALITAEFALEENRDVMAVPGNITQPLSEGTNNLIKAGAAPVTNADDVLDVLGLEPPAEESAPKAQAATAEEAHILELLSQGITETDALIYHAGWSAAEFNRIIATMEISGSVRRTGTDSWTAQ